MKRKTLTIRILCIILTLTAGLVISGQDNNYQLNHKKQLYDRFEKAVKDKEPKFVGGRYGGWYEWPNLLHSFVTWKFGEAKVFVEIFDYYVEQAAKDWMRINITENKMSHFRDVAIKLTNLGDEALMASTAGDTKLKNVQIMLRKGTILMKINASSPEVGKRFAGYLVLEIERHNRKEP